jgi:isopentenyl diphosphate isomerase/L-lactate dehydrogenase-like FMN-dependent dehydrogenase
LTPWKKIVDAVGDRIVVSLSLKRLTFLHFSSVLICHIQVTYDYGVRTASDVFKALALAANFVFIGQLWAWGLSVAGEIGVRHIMKALLAEFDILMNLSGYAHLKDLDRDALDSLPRITIMPSESTGT